MLVHWFTGEDHDWKWLWRNPYYLLTYIESGVCASGSIAKVLSGKRVHQRMNDAVERMIINKFCNTSPVCVSSEMICFAPLLALAENPSESSFTEVFSSDECMKMVHDYNRYKDGVERDCWARRQNYARYLPAYLTKLTNLPTSHPGSYQLLQDNGFSVSSSNVPGCRNTIDLTIEQTIYRHAKSSLVSEGMWQLTIAGVWLAISVLSMSSLHSTELTCYLVSTMFVHKSSKPAEIKRSETDVNNLVRAFSQFLDSFQIDVSDHESLFCILSGKPETPQISEDLLSCH